MVQNSNGGIERGISYVVSEVYNPDFKEDISASYYTKAIYNMTRICAELCKGNKRKR